MQIGEMSEGRDTRLREGILRLESAIYFLERAVADARQADTGPLPARAERDGANQVPSRRASLHRTRPSLALLDRVGRG